MSGEIDEEAEAKALAELRLAANRPTSRMGFTRMEKPEEHAPLGRRKFQADRASQYEPRPAAPPVEPFAAPVSPPGADADAAPAARPVRVQDALAAVFIAEQVAERRKAARRHNGQVVQRQQKAKAKRVAKAKEQEEQVPKSQPIEKAYFEEMKSKFPDVHLPSWKSKEVGGRMRKFACNIVDACDGDQELAVACVRYSVRRWDELNKRFFKGSQKAPDLTFVYGFFSKLIIEVQAWRAFAAVEQEWNEWQAKNPDAFMAPSDLRSRYDEARAKFEGGNKKR